MQKVKQSVVLTSSEQFIQYCLMHIQNLLQMLGETQVRCLLIFSVVVNTSHFYKKELGFLGSLMELYAFRPHSFVLN